MTMAKRGEVLVAIVNDKRDFAIAQNHNWYRIPVSSAQKWLRNRWPPDWLAFYQTKVFGPEAHSIRYFFQVIDINKVYRWQIFPDEPIGKKTNQQYYQLILNPLQKLPEPIFSRRWRRIVFIPTTTGELISVNTNISGLEDYPMFMNNSEHNINKNYGQHGI